MEVGDATICFPLRKQVLSKQYPEHNTFGPTIMPGLCERISRCAIALCELRFRSDEGGKREIRIGVKRFLRFCCGRASVTDG